MTIDIISAQICSHVHKKDYGRTLKAEIGNNKFDMYVCGITFMTCTCQLKGVSHDGFMIEDHAVIL